MVIKSPSAGSSGEGSGSGGAVVSSAGVSTTGVVDAMVVAGAGAEWRRCSCCEKGRHIFQRDNRFLI